MASGRSTMWLVFLVLAMASTYNGAKAQSSNSCTSVLISMSSCLNFISGNTSSPASTCCSALSNVVQSQPQCLCSALSSGAASSLGVAINQTRALDLPNVCNVKTPPVSQCGGGSSAGPSASGAAAPAGVPEKPQGSPATDIPSSGSGSKTIPSTDDDSNGSTVNSSLHLLAFVFAIVSYASAQAVF